MITNKTCFFKVVFFESKGKITRTVIDIYEIALSKSTNVTPFEENQRTGWRLAPGGLCSAVALSPADCLI